MHTGQSGGQEGANQNQILKATRIEAIHKKYFHCFNKHGRWYKKRSIYELSILKMATIVRMRII
jgi:hypothetical protein